MFAFVPSLDPRNTIIHLAQNVLLWQPPTGAEAAVVTEGTSANGDSAVNIGTSEPGVDTYSLDTKTKNLLEVKAVAKVVQSLRTPVKLTAIVGPSGRNGGRII